MLRVTCHVSHVTCHMYFFFFGQSGEAYRWRVCYQWSLPRLVLTKVAFTKDIYILNMGKVFRYGFFAILKYVKIPKTVKNVPKKSENK